MEKNSLKFILDRGPLVSPPQPINIPEKAIQAKKDEINKKHEPFIEEINSSGAYIELLISNDGLFIADWHLRKVPDELLDKLHA